MKLSISIVTYELEQQTFNSFIQSLNLAVDDLYDKTPMLNLELFFIDNAKDKQCILTTLQTLPYQKYRYRIIHGHGNIGFGSGHNLILNHLQSDYHLVLNSDVIMEKDVLSKSIQYLQSHTDVQALNPNAFDINEKQTFLCKIYPSLFVLFLRNFHSFKSLKINRCYEMREQINSQTELKGKFLLSGCFLLIRTKAFLQLKGFCEDYFMYFEDFDLSVKLLQYGNVAFLPSARIIHYGGNTAHKGTKHIIMFIKSATIFFRKHGWNIIWPKRL